MRSLLKNLILSTCGINLLCLTPVTATFANDEAFDDEHVTCFYVDEEDNDDCCDNDEGDHYGWRQHRTEFEIGEGVDEAWNLELDSAWPGQREDYSDNVIR